VHYTAVPAIVSPQLAQAAQEALVRNRAVAKRNATHDYLLGGGLLRCAVLLPDGQPCGATMHGETRGDGGSPRYRCCHQEAAESRRHTVLVRTVETAVWSTLRATLADSSTVLDGIRALADASSVQAAQAAAELRTVERTIAQIETQRDTLLNLHLSGGIDQKRFTEKDAALVGKQQVLQDQHAALAAHHGAAISQQLPLVEIEELCRRLAGKLDTLTFVQRQRVLRTLITSASTDQKTVHLDGVFDIFSMTVALDEVAGDGATGGIVSDTSVWKLPTFTSKG
jgi:hypothetical protein